jgi:RNA polymerase-interacting CarD/CdnL/TRCF family regulator
LNIPVGTPLIHPVHGPTILKDITTRTIGGVDEEYAVLEHTEQDLILQLPVASLDEHDLRAAMDPREANDVLEVLDAPAEGQSLTWRKMRSRNQSKMTSGEPQDIAMVVRDLNAKNERKGLSPSERTMLRKARARLVAELDLALDEDAEDVVEELLAWEDEDDE